MSSYTEEVGTSLNTLLELTFDAEKGFLKAAENTEHPNLKAFFTKKSTEFYDFRYELKEEIRKYGQTIEKGGSTTSTVHRAWMEIKSVFSFNNDEAILEEVLKVANDTMKEYECVLSNTDLLTSTAEILTNQKNIITVNINTIKGLVAID
ncbi:PA2169 family four-helix-bundle protein [Flavobacteriaceae bacterium KMM 6897]|nr:PA2169 family four-helix-bundle protein [Flavobacteriaceae bacterium KMM 6897]MEB8345231.1 PA2169 family four-helix-bundle protein [Flavobacteriaceae bacterium KMM 6898]